MDDTDADTIPDPDVDPEPLKEMEPFVELAPALDPEPVKVDVVPVLVPLVQGFPMPDENEEAVVQLSLQGPTTQDAKEEDEEPCFDWTDETTIGELLKQFPSFAQ